MLAYVFIGAISVIAVWLTIKRPALAVMCAVALIPWSGVGADIGVAISAYQVFFLPLLVRAIFNKRIRAIGAPVAVLCAYVLANSILNSFNLPEIDVYGGVLRSTEIRWILQVVVFVLTLAPVFVIPPLLRHPLEVDKVGNVFIYSCVLLALVGYFQIAVWMATGNNPLPIGAFNEWLTGEASREALIGMGGDAIPRMNSLSGEPRNCGTSLATALLMMFAMKQAGARFKAIQILSALILLIGILLTWSTSSFILLAIGVVVLTSVVFLAGPLLRVVSMGGFVQALLGTFVFVAVSATLIEWIFDYSLWDLVYSRTFGRPDPLIEDFDDAIIAYFADHPLNLIFGLGLGNAHLYANAYLLEEYASYAANTAFTAKAGYLKIISELGIVGLGLIIAVIVGSGFKLLKLARTKIPFSLQFTPSAVFLGMVVTFVTFMAVAYAPTVFLLLGMANYYRAALLQSKRNQGGNRSR